MLREMQSYIWDGSVAGTVAIAFSILSVFAAIYAYYVLDRLTRRTRYADKYNAAVDPWMLEARRSYAREKLVDRRDAKA
jgi:hypothetical protein